MTLKSRLTLRMGLVLPLFAVLIFLPAGSFHFWQGSVFLGITFAFSIAFIAYFYRRDPKLLERRLRAKETRREQKLFQALYLPLWVSTLALPGLDYRFGWSAAFHGGVPVWLTVAAWAIVAASWLLVIQVMRINSFAAAVIQIEAGQKVITDGPYRLVRHPMYTGFVLMTLATPFAMGSYVALVPAILLVPLVVFRLMDEERALREQLPGYKEYCTQTRFRLIPSVF